jgi:hypothetical protein
METVSFILLGRRLGFQDWLWAVQKVWLGKLYSFSVSRNN